jgi:hypothetical protein
VLELRQLAIDRELEVITDDAFVTVLSSYSDSTNRAVQVQADALRTLYAQPNAVLIQFYANMQSELYLDGQRILTAGDPKKPSFVVKTLDPGRHVLVAASAAQNYPLWTQVAVRDAGGYIVGTDGTWKHAINPSGKWMNRDYDDSGWSGFSGYSARVKGPPEEPYVWVEPDPFINTLSQANGLRPSIDWPDKKGRVIYRKVFEIE